MIIDVVFDLFAAFDLSLKSVEQVLCLVLLMSPFRVLVHDF